MADCFINRHGQSNSYTYGENIFDLEAFKITPILNGNVEWLDNGFILSATSNDCYTSHDAPVPYFEVKRSTMYELSWTATGAYGMNYVFFDYPVDLSVMINFSNQKKSIIFHTLTTTTKIVLRFGVQNAGTSCTFTDIKLRQIIQ